MTPAPAPAAPAAPAEEPSFILGAPIFVLQPGLITTNLINPPTVMGVTAESATELNLRFFTLIPTPSKYLALVAGTLWSPTVDGGGAPVFVYGGAVPLHFIGDRTGGWLTIAPDLIGLYGPSSDPANPGWEHNLLVELAILLNVGPKLLPKAPAPISGMSLYVLFSQFLTGPNDFNPVMQYGISIPLAPWPKSK